MTNNILNRKENGIQTLSYKDNNGQAVEIQIDYGQYFDAVVVAPNVSINEKKKTLFDIPDTDFLKVAKKFDYLDTYSGLESPDLTARIFCVNCNENNAEIILKNLVKEKHYPSAGIALLHYYKKSNDNMQYEQILKETNKILTRKDEEVKDDIMCLETLKCHVENGLVKNEKNDLLRAYISICKNDFYDRRLSNLCLLPLLPCGLLMRMTPQSIFVWLNSLAKNAVNKKQGLSDPVFTYRVL